MESINTGGGSGQNNQMKRLPLLWHFDCVALLHAEIANIKHTVEFEE